MQDTVIAAQTTVLAAEALGLGSCYIGDIIENYEQLQALLDLPPLAAPACCLIMGYPKRPTSPMQRRPPKESIFMENSYRRHDMSDAMWEILKPYTIGNKGTWGGNAKDTRQFLNGVFWILRTGAPWRDLPPEYGKWNTVQRRFCRWRDKGIWEKMLEAVIQEPDFEWLMIDASHIKVHPHASGAPGGNQDMARTKGGSTPKYIWPWMRMVCRSDFLSQQVPLLIVHRLVP